MRSPTGKSSSRTSSAADSRAMTTKTPRRALFRAAMLCAAVPPAAGLALFVAWTLTRNPGLVAAGTAVLLYGIALWIVGAVLLAVHVRRERARGASSALVSRDRRNGGLALLAFAPFAAMIVGALFVSSESYAVTVDNEGLVRIDAFAIIDQATGRRVELGGIAPGQKKSTSIHIGGKTSLAYEMLRFSIVSTGTLCGYTESGLAGQQWSTVTVGVDGRAAVEESTAGNP